MFNVLETTASISLDEECSCSNKVFTALFSISLVVNAVLGIIVGFQRKNMQSIPTVHSDLFKWYPIATMNQQQNSSTMAPSHCWDVLYIQPSWVKFPDNATEMELPWLNDSYVHLNGTNKTLHFKVCDNVKVFSLFNRFNSAYCRI